MQPVPCQGATVGLVNREQNLRKSMSLVLLRKQCVCVCVCTPVCRAETERLFARLPRVVTMMPFPVITFYIEFLASSGNNS